MTNKLLSPTKMMAGLTILAGILGTTKESLAQNLASNGNNKTQSSINTVSSISPTDFAVANVGKYYPDMVDYTKKLMNSFISDNQKDFVNKTLVELIKKYPNDKDKVSFIISTLEGRVFITKPIFADTYCLEPTDLDFDLDDAFNSSYRTRFNTNLANLQQRIKEIEENIKNKEENIKNKEENIKNMKEDIKNMEEETRENIKNIGTILESFSKDDILRDKNLYDLMKRFKEACTKYGRTTSPHIKELFSIIK